MSHHILVVDDESDFEALITQKFRREIRAGNYRFSFACNGKEAYQQIIQNADIAIVLTDINMPVMDGLKLLSTLNTLKHPPKVVVVSAYGDMGNIRTAMNHGAFDFLIKPINLQDLEVTLTKTINEVTQNQVNQARLKQTQLQLVQREKMVALGQMVASIAHEINNPINFVHGNINPAVRHLQALIALVEHYQQVYPYCLLDLPDELQEVDFDFICKDLPKLLTSLKLGTNRIRDLVFSLRNFSRLDEAALKAIDLHMGIDNTLVILNHRLKAQHNRPAITIEKRYGNLPMIECYASQINQVVMNILANAIDALEEKLKTQTLTPKITIQTELTPQNQAIISIADNGLGMSKSTCAKIFDHFFTTKEVGKGTGLGLSISYQIITENHQGQLYCQSTPEQGTEFHIEIPVVQNNAFKLLSTL